MIAVTPELYRRLFDLACERDLPEVLQRILDLVLEESGAERGSSSPSAGGAASSFRSPAGSTGRPSPGRPSAPRGRSSAGPSARGRRSRERPRAPERDPPGRRPHRGPAGRGRRPPARGLGGGPGRAGPPAPVRRPPASFAELQDAKRLAGLALERAYAEERLRDTLGHVAAASRRAGLSRPSFYALLERAQVDVAAFRRGPLRPAP